MRIFKSHPLLRLVNSYVIDSSQPSNISYLWNFGSLLAFSLIIQIITGVTLAMHYSPSVLEAFNSVEHIMRDVNNGWLIRYLHANTASAFFFIVYLHIGRGLYYGSYRAPRTLVWTIGTVIFILLIATAFLGYKHSPKWYNFFSNVYLFNVFINVFICIFMVNLNKFVKVNFLSVLGTKFNNSLEYYVNKIIVLNKKMSIVYIWLIVIILVIGLSLSIYTAFAFYNNIDLYINVHIMMFNNNLKKFIEENQLKPVYIYDDIHLDKTRTIILKETKNLSGIYLIFNKVTSDYYIGSASTNRFYARFSNHLLYLKGSKIVKHAVRKYKLKNFVFLILELFPDIIDKENNKKLLDIEDFYLKSLLPNYNILTEAGSSFGYKHTEISRIKMKNNYSIQRREFIANLNKGKILSFEIVEKIREKALMRKKVNYSEKSLLNMKKNSKPIILYNLNNTIFGEYFSIIEAADYINCSPKTIRRALKTEKKILKIRFIVKFKN